MSYKIVERLIDGVASVVSAVLLYSLFHWLGYEMREIDLSYLVILIMIYLKRWSSD